MLKKMLANQQFGENLELLRDLSSLQVQEQHVERLREDSMETADELDTFIAD